MKISKHIKSITRWIDKDLVWFFTSSRKMKNHRMIQLLSIMVEGMIETVGEHGVMDDQVKYWKEDYKNIYEQYERDFFP